MRVRGEGSDSDRKGEKKGRVVVEKEEGEASGRKGERGKAREARK